jgi:Bacteriophage translational regulator
MNDIFQGMGVEVTLTKPDSFNIVRESLTRIGVAAKNEQILYQSAHILHKQGRYAIVHFKELFALDGKPSTIVENDYARRNTIANLLQQWELVKIVSTEETRPTLIIPAAPLSQIKIISFKDKADWQLIAKYSIGAKKKV